MLVLERKAREKVRIVSPTGEKFFVHFIREKGGKGVLGFEFPADFKILRDELEPHGSTDPTARAA